MRITKVDIKTDRKNKSKITLQRDIEQGYLQHGEQCHRGETAINALLEKKTKEFAHSLLGKTLKKAADVKDKKQCSGKEEKEQQQSNEQHSKHLKQLEKIIRYYLTHLEHSGPPRQTLDVNLTGLQQLTEEKFSHYFKHKFVPNEGGSLPYYQSPTGEKVEVDLLKVLYQALGSNQPLEAIRTASAGYRQWAREYIERKQARLATSIVNNKIAIQLHTPSPDGNGLLSPANASVRKRVFTGWLQQLLDYLTAPECKTDNLRKEDVIRAALSLQEIEQDLKLDTLIQQWQQHFEKTDKEQTDKKNLDSGQKSRIGLPIDYFGFKRQLKVILQQHTRAYVRQPVWKEQHSQYLLEVSKYLQRYFPLKTSSRRLDKDDITYYLSDTTVRRSVALQIHNTLLQHLLQHGKALHYAQQQEKIETSADLQRIKNQQAFALQFINACALASSNLRSGIDPTDSRDVLSKDTLKKLFAGQLTQPSPSQGASRLCRFFAHYVSPSPQAITPQQLLAHLSDTQHYHAFVSAVRGVIATIRNGVLHYQGGSLGKLLSTSLAQYEKLPENTTETYTQSYLCTLLKQELEQLPALYSEKLSSDGLFDYYPLEKIQQHFTQYALISKPLPFIPGFKTVHQWGRKYQADLNSGLNLHCYLSEVEKRPSKAQQQGAQTRSAAETGPSKEQRQGEQTRYNALAAIYQQYFIPVFIDNKEGIFTSTVSKVLGANKKRADNKERAKKKNHAKKQVKSYAYAFEQVQSYPITTGQPVIDYLAYVQSELMLEENKKRHDPHSALTATDTAHFQQFIWQLFLTGFDTFIGSDQWGEWQWLKHPEQQFIASTEQQRKDKRALQIEAFTPHCQCPHAIKADDNWPIAVWAFCKMLDAPHLNELSNQFSKWQQHRRAQNMAIDENLINVWQQIIALCLLTVDKIPSDHTLLYPSPEGDPQQGKDAFFKALEPYLTAKFTRLQLQGQQGVFVQDDGHTPIIQRGVELAYKYSTSGCIQHLIDKNHLFRLGLDTINQWQEWDKRIDNTSLASISLRRQQLHREWIDNKRTEQQWLKKNETEYEKLITTLERYQWLKHQVTLQPVSELHHLLLTLLGRLNGFIALWERDFRYLVVALNDLVPRLGTHPLGEALDISKFPKAYKTVLYHCFLDPHNTHFEDKKYHDRQGSWKEKRNYIAHYQFLNRHLLLGKTSKPKEPKEQKEQEEPNELYQASLLQLFSYLRGLLSYDRKLKNAVSKALIDLLASKGINIIFKPLHDSDHQLKIDRICSLPIQHLGGKVKGKWRAEEYIQRVKALLEQRGEEATPSSTQQRAEKSADAAHTVS